jgi:predicted transposase/invertase (TIGR01784 family)
LTRSPDAARKARPPTGTSFAPFGVVPPAAAAFAVDPLASGPGLRQEWAMLFADLKNDFVFRRIFATHPDILRGLLNDLLDRRGEKAIVSLEYLPSEQLPRSEGAKLSILDVRCKDGAGTTFVVEMQLIHHPGFINRVVYNACKAYAGQLKAGGWYTDLTDVVAIAICDFVLWPDARQGVQTLPPIPMLSRWSLAEETCEAPGFSQVRYAFLELPKVPKNKPETAAGAAYWAWLFVHAPELKEVPAELPEGPYRDALELANQAKFSLEELQAYERVRDEIRQVLEIAAARWAEGKAEGKAEGATDGDLKARRDTLVRLLGRTGLALTEDDGARIEACADAAVLDRWFDNAFGAKTTTEVFA